MEQNVSDLFCNRKSVLDSCNIVDNLSCTIQSHTSNISEGRQMMVD
jgi:hypothetical protein